MFEQADFVKARSTMIRDQAARRAERFGRVIRDGAFDESALADVPDDPEAPPIVFHMVYQDAKMRLTGRCLTLRRLMLETDEVRVTGYCHMRRALRTFLASNIVEITDLSTGEVFEDGLRYFSAHPLLRHLTPDDATLSLEGMALQECRDEIILLNMLAASDGEIAPEELDVIVDHVLNAFPEEGVSIDVLRDRISSIMPDEWAFDRALRRLAAKGGTHQALRRTMRKLVDADGRLGADEVAFVMLIEETLGA